MLIVIDGRMVLSQMSGVGRYLISLSQAINQLDSGLKFELWLQDTLPNDHPARRLGGQDLQVRTFPMRHMSLGGQLRLPGELRRAHVNLLHYPHFDLPWTAPKPVVATIHDLKYIVHPEFFPTHGRVKRALVELLTRHTCLQAERIICVSSSTRADLHQRLGVPNEKLRVVHSGVDARFFQEIPSDELKAFQAKKSLERPFILFVGERRPHKNLPVLMEAFQQLRGLVDEDCQLVIAGRSYSDYRTPEEMVTPLGLGQSVRFLDYVDDDELPLLYHSARAFALLSRYEGFGFPVLEAMASGTPVVAAKCTALPEIVGEAGLLVPPNDSQQTALALAVAVTPGERRDQLTRQGLELAQTFTWRRCAEQTVDIYRKVLGL